MSLENINYTQIGKRGKVGKGLFTTIRMNETQTAGLHVIFLL